MATAPGDDFSGLLPFIWQGRRNVVFRLSANDPTGGRRLDGLHSAIFRCNKKHTGRMINKRQITSLLVRYIQHIQQPDKCILAIKTGIRQPSLFISPFR